MHICYSNTSMVGQKRLHRSLAYYWRKCKIERGTTNIDSLPDELLLEILTRLPDDPDYLHNKARLVCRRWRRLIHSHDFIKRQLHRSTYGLLFCLGDHATFVTATQGLIEASEISYKVPTNSILRSSCNGLVVHQCCGIPVTVTNPVTRQQFVLPSFPHKEIVQMLCYRCSIGYAADSMEYKVVLPYENKDQLLVIGITSVGSDNSWRHVGGDDARDLSRAVDILVEPPMMACTSEGFITWSSYEDGSYVKFDVETEILTVHPSPVPKACLVGTRSFYLSTGRSLSLLVVHKYKKYLFQLWEMKAETGEWRKVAGDIKLRAHELRLRQFLPQGRANARLKPVGWVRYPEVLALRFSRGTTCIFFNLNTQQISSMKLPKGGGYYYSHAHKKSLTWFT